MAAKQRASDNLGAGLLGAYALVAWCVLGDASLPFPLSEQDQHRVASAVGTSWGLPSDSWVAEALDPWMATLLLKDPFSLLLLLRRLAGTLALMGLVIWAWRGLGWIRGIWVAVLGISLLPLRWVAGTLAPQSFCLALLIWGHLLLHGHPWSKTGMAEAFGGGVLLGATAFAAPWGWLFCMAVPLHALWSKTYRAKLESGFWWGLGLGFLPGVVWWWTGRYTLHDFGFHPETLTFEKIPPLMDLIISGWRLPVVLLVVLGLRSLCHPAVTGTHDLIWPFIVAMIFGYGDLSSSSLGLPGVILLAVMGLERVGQIFISRTERILIPTLLALGIGYYLFFVGHSQIREQQAFSRQIAGLAELVVEKIPGRSAVLLGRHNSILLYLNALDRERGYLPLDGRIVSRHMHDLPSFLAAKGVCRTHLWINPVRVSALEGSSVVEHLMNSYRYERVIGPEDSELVRVNLTALR